MLACLGLFSICAGAQTLPLLYGEEAPDRERFSFIVHGDLTGGERPGIFAVAARQVAMLQPDFVISVGDLIEGDGEDAAALNREWDAYAERAAAMRSPVYLVSGNHDVTSALQRDVWRTRFGPSYYHFRVGDVLFLVLDTEDYSERRRAEITRARDEALVVARTEGWDAFAETAYGRMPERVSGGVGKAQGDYFLEVLADHADVRWTFLFMHKAAWEGEANAAFRRLEAALAERPYTVFHGHEHAQKYEQRQERDYIRLATTGGVQLTENGRSVDHLALVTVGDRVSVATLDLAGIRDGAGELPLDGAQLCFDVAVCGEK